MKKHLIAALLVLVMCLAAVSGCSLVRGFEKDLQVILEVNGEYRGCYTVNAFNNAIVPIPDGADVPEGLMFYGWTPQENWQEAGASNVPLSENKGLIRYDDVKDYADGAASVTLYAVFGEKPKHDLVVAWYDKFSTSGLNAEIVAAFTEDMYEYLVKIAKDVWKYDLKRKVGDFKAVELYVKPEESVVYYVINGEEKGQFNI